MLMLNMRATFSCPTSQRHASHRTRHLISQIQGKTAVCSQLSGVRLAGTWLPCDFCFAEPNANGS